MLKKSVGATTVLVMAVAATVALAAGETVDTTLGLKQATKIKKKTVTKGKKKTTVITPGQLAVHWRLDIKKPDGSRAANLSGGELTLPKAIFADEQGFQTCPLEKLNANDNKSCPAKSVLGKAEASIYTAPVREAPYIADGIIYFTGKKGKAPTFAIYYTLREIPSAHSVTPGKVTKSGATSKISFEQPHVPTVPGLPDATPVYIDMTFDAKGPKGLLFRIAKPCKKGTTSATRYTFYDDSSVSGSTKAC